MIGTARRSDVAIQNSIAVTNSGDVLAIWSERPISIADPLLIASSTEVYANQGAASGAWGTAMAMPQISNLASDDIFTGLPLRVNANGDAVVGWTEQLAGTPHEFHRKSRLLRYSSGLGWSPTAIELLFPVGPLFGQTVSSDLQLLDDGTVAFSDMVDVTAANPSVKVYRQRGTAAPAPIKDVGSFLFANSPADVFFAADASGNGVGTILNGIDANVRGFDLNINNPPSTGTGNFILVPNSPRRSCLVGAKGAFYARPTYAAVSNARWSTFLFTTADSSTPHCFLKLGIRDNVGVPVRVTSSTPSTYVFQTPVLAMDQVGNGVGVAVWQQWSGDVGSATVVPVWAQTAETPDGKVWTSPQVIGSNGSTVGTFLTRDPIRFALNRTGQQGVAAATVFARNLLYIVTARFSASSGWTDWTYAAASTGFSSSNVAINDAGEAFLVYAALACARAGEGIFPDCRGNENVYVLKLE